MARIRSIKPDAFRSSTLSTVPVSARWTFAGLWTYVDDAGRGLYNPRLIWSDLYPLDESTSPQDVEADLKALVGIGAIELYEVDGKTYFYIPAWEEHQSASFRRSEPIHPPPPARGRMQKPANDANTGDDALTSTNSDLHDSARGRMQESAGGEGSKEKGEGRREKGGENAREARATAAELPPVFVAFCEAYPDRVQTRPAMNAWTQAVKRTNGKPDLIIEGAQRYAAWLQAQGSRAPFTRSAVKWLNEDGWLDNLKPANGRASPSNIESHVALVNKLAAKEQRQIGTGT